MIQKTQTIPRLRHNHYLNQVVELRQRRYLKLISMLNLKRSCSVDYHRFQHPTMMQKRSAMPNGLHPPNEELRALARQKANVGSVLWDQVR